MKRGLSVLLILCVCLSLSSIVLQSTVIAQTAPTATPEPDTDGDGVPDSSDGCPREPGPASNRGCPLPDSDGDGTPDDSDQCPNQPGPVWNAGCPEPDSDGDGIADSNDQCPNEPGLVSNNGCPAPSDTDGDGIADASDQCPNQPGPVWNNGCPEPGTDSDGDGITDANDQCPSQPGPSSNSGCPISDSDGDGVVDGSDQCPNQAGPVSNNGCPAPSSSGQPSGPEQQPADEAEQPAGQEPPAQPIVLPALPTDGPCVVATQGTSRVNVRSEPSSSNPDTIVDQMLPNETGQRVYFQVIVKELVIKSPVTPVGDSHENWIDLLSVSHGVSSTGEDELWYLVETQNGPAWVFSGVVRQGGDCDTLPVIQRLNDPQGTELALQPFTFTSFVPDGLLPEVNFDGAGVPTVICDAALQQVIDCEGPAHIPDGTSNTILLGEKFDTSEVDASGFEAWEVNTVPILGDTMGEFVALPPDSEEAALLLPAIQKVRDAANRIELLQLDLLADQGFLPDFARKNGSIVVYDTQSDDVPTETLSLNFGKIEDQTTMLLSLGNLPDDPTPGGIVIFDQPLIDGAEPQPAIIIVPLMDDEGGLQNVIVYFVDDSDQSTTGGDPDQPIIVGSLPNAEQQGLALILVPALEEGQTPAEAWEENGSILWISW